MRKKWASGKWQRQSLKQSGVGVASLVGGMALVVYLLTMAPRLTWATNLAQAHIGRDGGDLVSAAWVMGVPHPTGYPTYTMLAWLFTRLPFGGIAWRVHLLSGLAGAGTVALAYAIGRRWARGRARMSGLLAWGAALGALLLGFASLFWAHAIIAEVHTLHLFFMALVLWLMLRWRDGAGPLPLAALAFGLGMGNHVTLAFLAPFILMLLWSGRERLCWRTVLWSALALAAGLTVYAYLPWRAATGPVINWGAADTREGFWWMVSGRGYRRFFFALPRDELAPRLGQWWRLSLEQFPLPLWLLALLGLWDLRREPWLALGSLLHAATHLVYALGYNVSDAFVYLLPAYFYVALWMGRGAAFLLEATHRLYESDKDQAKAVSLVAAGLMLAPLISLASEWQGMDLTHDWEVENYAQEALEAVEPGSLILVAGDRNTFALWYYRYAEEWRPDVMVVNYVMLSFDWYRRVVTTHHPEMVLPDLGQTSKLNAVLLNLEQRAVYIAENEDKLADMQLTPAGPLWRVTEP